MCCNLNFRKIVYKNGKLKKKKKEWEDRLEFSGGVQQD